MMKRALYAGLLTLAILNPPVSQAEPGDAARARAAKRLVCPPGTHIEGGVGFARSSFGCARSSNLPSAFHGPYAQWYPDGTLALFGQQADGQPTGEWRWWHPSGKLQGHGTYEAGEPVGTWTRYGEDGTATTEVMGPVLAARALQWTQPAVEASNPSQDCTAIVTRMKAVMATAMRSDGQLDWPAHLSQALASTCAATPPLHRRCWSLSDHPQQLKWCVPNAELCVEAVNHLRAIMPEDTVQRARRIDACLSGGVLTADQTRCIRRATDVVGVRRCLTGR